MQIINPKQSICHTRIFLEGSIPQLGSWDWRSTVAKHLTDYNVSLYNPYVSEYSSWHDTSHGNDKIKELITWKQEAMDCSDIIFINFQPPMLSPCSILELGTYINSGKLIVVCHKEFHIRDNIEITCRRHGVTLFEDLDDAIEHLQEKLNNVTEEEAPFGL